jgi:hypothetical protein
MTPKEKAEVLVYKYYHLFSVKLENNRKIMKKITNILLCIYEAKHCALIAVDEIINANPHSNPLNTESYSTMNYWHEVKQELEKI